ncbi:MAG: polymer-forming cytoskeletal protein [Oscillospiraceae bacterium]|nr:polymer-forming cytoskeletal protein [Oscillospiraceae bacterium]
MAFMKKFNDMIKDIETEEKEEGGSWSNQAEAAQAETQEQASPKAPSTAMTDSISTTATVLAEGIVLKGTISGSGNVLIKGDVIGDIKLDGKLTIAKTGSVIGPVEGSTIEILGNVEGDIVANTQLSLFSTGTVKGNIQALAINIEKGGKLNGSCTMIAPAPKEEPAPAVEPPKPAVVVEPPKPAEPPKPMAPAGVNENRI